MVDILDETLADLKEQKKNEMIYKYGKIVLVCIAALIIGMIVKAWWDGKAYNAAQEEGAQFIDLARNLREGKPDVEAMKKLMEGKSIYSTLSGLNLALIQGYSGDFVKSAETYSYIANNKQSDASLKEYANLMSITMGLASQNLSNDDAIKKLDEYISNKEAVFAFSAKEMKAALLLESEKREDAKVLLEEILKSNEAPSAVKARAYQMLLIASPKKQ